MRMVDGLSKLRAKHLKKAEEARKKLRPNVGLQSWGFVYEDGTYDLSQGAACLMQVPHYHRMNSLFFVDRTISPNHSKISFEDSRNYIDYVLNHSYWRHPFVTKDPEEAFKKGVILKTNYPTRYTLSASIAIRFVREWPERIHAWNKIMSLVNHGDLSLMLAHRFLVNVEGMLFRQDGPTNHPMLTHFPGDEIIRAVVSGDYEWMKKHGKLSQDGGYTGLTTAMPGGDVRYPNFSCPDFGDLCYEETRKFTNTLGLPDEYTVTLYRDKDEEEAKWAEKVINLYLKGQKNEEGDDHKPKPRVRKIIRAKWVGLDVENVRV